MGKIYMVYSGTSLDKILYGHKSNLKGSSKILSIYMKLKKNSVMGLRRERQTKKKTQRMNIYINMDVIINSRNEVGIMPIYRVKYDL